MQNRLYHPNFFYFLVLFLIGPFSSFQLAAQVASNFIVDVQQFSLEDGLPHQKIHSLTEDSNGFIWISTPKGIARYDGYNFKWFTTKKIGFELGDILDIQQDKDGWLWLMAFEQSKIYLFHPETEEILTAEERFGKAIPFELVGFTRADLAILPNYVHGQISKGQSGNLFFFSRIGENIFIYKGGGIFETLAWDKEGLGRDILEEGKVFFWGTSFHKVYKVNKETNETKTFNGFIPMRNRVYDWQQEKYISTYLRAGETITLENGKDSLIEQTYGAFYKIDSTEQIKLGFEAPTGYLPYFFHKGQYWCLGDAGWKVYDLNGSLLFELNRANYDRSLFEAFSQMHLGVFIDSKDRIWLFGEFGVSLIQVEQHLFKQYFTNEGETPLPFNNSVRGIWANEDSLIVNFEFGGLVQFNHKAPDDYTILDSHPFYSDVTKTKNSYLGRPLLSDKKGDFWVGHEEYLMKWSADISTYKKYFFKSADNLSKRSNIFSLYQDKKDNIWIGTLDVLEWLPAEGDSIQPIIFDEQVENQSLFIVSIIPETDSTIWLCGKTGLYLFNTEQKQLLQKYHSEGKGANYLPAKEYFHLYIDATGNKWIGSAQGLIYWNEQTGEKRLFTREDGLSNEEIVGIYEDKHQHLWLASRYGIIQFDKKNFRVVNTFLPKDGTTYHRNNRIAHFQEADGTIYFGGYNGITAFQPDDFYQENSLDNSPLVITNFSQFDGTDNLLANKTPELWHSNTITLQANDRFLRLEFALLNFDDSNNNYYAWKIEGVNDNWNYQRENFLQLGQPPYGDYQLRIKGQGRNGLWPKQELSVQLKVLKPFYLQTWFLLLGLVSLLTLAFGLYFLRTRRYVAQQAILKQEVQRATEQIETDKQTIEAQANALKQLDKVKSNFFANVSHELRTPLTLILGPISSILKNNNLPNRDFTLLKRAQQSGQDLLKLIGAILDLSKMEAGKLDLKETPLTLFTFFQQIMASFEGHALNKEILLTLDYTAGQQLQFLLDKEKLTTILNNLLANAIKFTPRNGIIEVKVSDLGNQIQIMVQDTGRGIHPDDLPNIFNRFYQSNQPETPTEGGTGIGLSLSQELVKIMNGSIWVESEFNKGSTFFVNLPRKEIIHAPTQAESNAQLEEEIQEVEEVAPLTLDTISIEKPTLLIVEDNYLLQGYLSTILAPYYTLKFAEDGIAALASLAQNVNEQEDITSLPDLIISDVMMPRMDGFQLLTALKKDKRWNQLPVIMLTAKANLADKLKALQIGVDDYLLKPFEEAELLLRIQNLIQNAKERGHYRTEIREEKTAEKPVITAEEQEWLKKAESIVLSHIRDTQFSVSNLAEALLMGERSLLRQMKKLTGLRPNQYIQEIRFNEARKMLEQKTYSTIAKIANEVGYKNVKTFSRRFKERFGKSPSNY